MDHSSVRDAVDDAERINELYLQGRKWTDMQTELGHSTKDMKRVLDSMLKPKSQEDKKEHELARKAAQKRVLNKRKAQASRVIGDNNDSGDDTDDNTEKKAKQPHYDSTK